MTPSQRFKYARWIFGSGFHSDRDYEAGKFRFSNQDGIATETGVTLTWQEYCHMFYLRWSIRHNIISIGKHEGYIEGYDHDQALEEVLNHIPLTDQERKRCDFQRWLIDRGHYNVGPDEGSHNTAQPIVKHEIDIPKRPISDVGHPTTTKGVPCPVILA